MSYKHMNETEARLKQEIDALLAAAEKTDAEEDALYGKGKRGDELPAEFERRVSRLRNITEAKAALEQKAKEEAAQQRAEAEQKLAEREEEELRTGKKKSGRKPEKSWAGDGSPIRETTTGRDGGVMDSMKNWMFGAAVLAGAAGLGSIPAHAAEFGVYVRGPVAYVPPSPEPGYFWTAGYMANGFWIPGRWSFGGYDRDRFVDRDYYRHDRDRDRDHDRFRR